MSTATPPPSLRTSAGLAGIFRMIGPGIVVVGSVIGGGELINTPLQAAQFGFTLLWAVILACVIKLFLQIEIGRHAVVHQRTTVELLNLCPGTRWRGVSWAPLVYMGAYTVSLATSVGIIGSLAGLMQAILPALGDSTRSAALWGAGVVVLAAALLRTGAYGHLEKLVAALVAVFCVSVLVAVVHIQGTEYRIRGDEALGGLRLSLGDQPRLAAFAVISLLGALGTTANELFMYPYWILEKGYGRDLAGAEGAAWLAAARRWIRGLRLDAGLATLVATVATVAFYLLGAAVLHREGVKPEGLAVVRQISQVFTRSQGSWSYALFMAGAFATLFSTLVVATAATGRMWADVLASLRLIDRGDPRAIGRTHQAIQVVYLAGMYVAYLLFLRVGVSPGALVVYGQFLAGMINTPLIMFGICWAAFQTDRRVRMGRLTATLVVGSAVAIASCLVVGLAIERGWWSAAGLLGR